MSSAYYAPLVTMPTVIDGPGRYVTRCGETVVIDKTPEAGPWVLRPHAHDCHGNYSTGQRDHWHRTGRIFAGQLCNNDIVAKEPS